MGSKERLLCIIDGKASYYVYTTNNGNNTVLLLFRVALVLVDIRYNIMCIWHVIYARRVYISSVLH